MNRPNEKEFWHNDKFCDWRSYAQKLNEYIDELNDSCSSLASQAVDSYGKACIEEERLDTACELLAHFSPTIQPHKWKELINEKVK